MVYSDHNEFQQNAQQVAGHLAYTDAAKKSAQEAFLKSILSKEGKSWSDFYKYVKRRKGNKENIPAIKDCTGLLFSSEGNILHIQGENTVDPFTTDIKTTRRRIKTIGKNKSVGPDWVSGEILAWKALQFTMRML